MKLLLKSDVKIESQHIFIGGGYNLSAASNCGNTVFNSEIIFKRPKGQKACIVVVLFQTDHIVANYRRPRFEGLQSKIDNKGIEIGHLRLSSSAIGPIFLLKSIFLQKIKEMCIIFSLCQSCSNQFLLDFFFCVFGNTYLK